MPFPNFEVALMTGQDITLPIDDFGVSVEIFAIRELCIALRIIFKKLRYLPGRISFNIETRDLIQSRRLSLKNIGSHNRLQHVIHHRCHELVLCRL